MPRSFGITNFQRYASAPAVGVAGDTYYNTTSGIAYVSTGSAWVAIGSGGGGSAEVNVSTAGPSPRVGELLWIDTDDTTILTPPPNPVGTRWSSEFTIDSGSVAAAGQSTPAAITHNLGAPGLIVGHIEDGSWSHQFGWRMALNTSTQVAVAFLNQGPNPGQAILRFRMLY